MKSDDMTITVRVDDQATPVLQRLRREVWWWQNGDRVLGALAGVVIFGLGVLLGGALR